MELLSNGWNVLLIILGFGLLIFVHELGHFLAARWAGIRCESFAIGMGPSILAFRPGVGWVLGSTDPRCVSKFGKHALDMSDDELKANGVGETEYSVRALPLGGFVRMLGQDDMNPSEVTQQARSYSRVAIWKRMIVVSAGVTANLITAIALFIIAFMVGVQFEGPVVGGVLPGSPAATAIATNAAAAGVTAPGLQVGDKILRIDDDKILTFADVQIAGAMARPGTSYDLVVERPGVTLPIEFSIEPKFVKAFGMPAFGVDPSHTTTLNSPTSTQDREEIRAQLEALGVPASVTPGSNITALDGKPVDNLGQVSDAFQASSGKPVSTQWTTADGQTVTANLNPLPSLQLLFGPRAGSGKDAKDRNFNVGLLGLVPLVQVGSVMSGSPNDGVLQPGDVILRFGSTIAPTNVTLSEIAQKHKGKKVTLQLQRGPSAVEVTATVSDEGKLNIIPARALGVNLIAHPMSELGPPLDEPGENFESAVAPLNLLPLTRIVQVADQPVHNWIDLRGALQRATAQGAQRNQDTTVALQYELPTSGHEKITRDIVVSALQAKALQDLAWEFPAPGSLFQPLNVTLHADGNPLTAAAMGFRQTGKMITMTYLTLDRIFRGSVALEQLRGPVGIVHLGSKAADRGFMWLLFFLAAISVNLAVLNFLPLPIVDGGLFLYLVYERITGRPPSVAFQNGAIAVGLCLIGSIFLFTFYQDVVRLVT